MSLWDGGGNSWGINPPVGRGFATKMLSPEGLFPSGLKFPTGNAISATTRHIIARENEINGYVPWNVLCLWDIEGLMVQETHDYVKWRTIIRYSATYLFEIFWDFPVLQSLGSKCLIVLKYMKRKKWQISLSSNLSLKLKVRILRRWRSRTFQPTVILRSSDFRKKKNTPSFICEDTKFLLRA